jgi:hypothetical protein
MLNEVSRFEVRKMVQDPERDNALIQAGYDIVDRMAALLDGITFGELLTQPFKELMPRIIANVEQTASYGLIDHPEEVVALLERMNSAHGDETYHSIASSMCDEDSKLSNDIKSPVWHLWVQHGVRLPEFNRFGERNAPIKKAMDDLIALAPDFTYRSAHEAQRSKDLQAAFMSIHAAAEHFIIYLPQNSRCCGCPSTCACFAAVSTDYCVASGGVCSPISTYCGSSMPPG